MNRKKISLLLTGLVITSSIFMGCASSNKGNTSSDNGLRTAQEDPIFRQASERQVTQYNGDMPVEYPNNAIDSYDQNSLRNGLTTPDLENQFNNTQNYDNNTNLTDSGLNSGNVADANSFNGSSYNGNGTDIQNYQSDLSNGQVPSNASENSNSYGNSYDQTSESDNSYNLTRDSKNSYNGTQNFDNSSDQISGFSNVIDDDYTNENSNSQNYNGSNASTNYGSSSYGENTNSMQGRSGSSTNDTTGMSSDNSGTSVGNSNDSLSNSPSDNSYGSSNSSSTQNSSNASSGNSTTSTPQLFENNGGANDNNTSNGMSNYNNSSNTDDSSSYGSRNSRTADSGESTDTQDIDGQAIGKAQVDKTKLAGQITVVNVKGGSEITGGKPQGTAEISFKLSGDVLKATSGSDALSTLLQNAYEETRKDANASYAGTPTTTEREKLQAALATIFAPSDSKLKMIFKSGNNEVKIIDFKAQNMFPAKSTSADYVRHIIDIDSTSAQSTRNARTARSANAADIVIKMLVKVETPDGIKELKTNTEYIFVGTEGDANFEVTPVDSTKDQVTGFTVPNFTTGKIPSKIGASDSSGSVIYEGESSSTQGTQKTDLYTNQITGNTYIDMKKLIDGTQVTSTGTSLRFKSIVFNDTDKTITKVELEDDRGIRYPATLTAVDSSDSTKGSYLEVNNLKRDTPYIFTRIDITSRVSTETETKTLYFANFDNGTLAINNLSIKTTAFSNPQLTLGAVHDQKVKLPSGLEIEAVKNDSTALRYILKVDNPEGFIGDVRINGLRAGEESKVEKIVDEKAKINYYVVTLSKLTKNTDYGFLILEVDYRDPEGNQQVGRQALGDINKDGTGVTDNKTESTALTGTNLFNVVLNESVTSENPRSIDVPIFIDDIQGRFVRIDFTAPKDNTSAKVVYEDNTLKFTDLNPESNTVCKVDFIYKNSDDREETISKYVKISTPRVGDLDIKSSRITASETTADIVFEFYTDPKVKVRTVVVKDSQEKEIKSTWTESSKTLTLEGLSEKTEYSDLTATFTLDNGKTVKHSITTFTTEEAEIKPTGKVADFVERVYKIALGRNPEVEGWNYWIQKLQSKEITATEFIAENLMTQSEFVDRELSKKSFVTTMYSLIVNREPDEDGQKYWEGKYEEYRTGVTSIEALRIKIAREMMGQSEFRELVSSLGLQY